jgi:putative transcriptional regulator
MKTIELPKAGCILISDPFLPDQYFSRTIVLMAEHGPNGSLGIILNRPSEFKLSEINTRQTPEIFKDMDLPLFVGGPVHLDRLYFLCKDSELLKEDSKIIDGIYWGGDLETAKELLQSGKIKTDEIRFFIGYSSWEPGQLQREINEKSWLISQANAKFLMNNQPEILWSKVVKNLEEKYFEWAAYPLNPYLN